MKLGDFGLSTKSKFMYSKSHYSAVGTDCYMAPEVKDERKQGKAADIWGIGLLLIEMCTLTPTWEYSFDFGIRSLSFPNDISSFIEKEIDSKYDPIKPLIKRMLNPDPMERPCIDAIMKKKIIKKSNNSGSGKKKKRKMSGFSEKSPSGDKTSPSSESGSTYKRKGKTERSN
jgi:serine/threonine protein kinase